MIDKFLYVLRFIWLIVRIPVFGFAVFGFVFCIAVGIYLLIEFRKGRRFKKGERNRISRPPWWKNVFYYLPKQYVDDLLSRDPEFFRHQGCIIYTGRQGSGKTIAMVEQTLQWQQEYPKAKTITNLGLVGQNDVLDKWQKLIDYKNGIQGVIADLDEMQNWFSSNQSKNFPPEMLEVVTQNRKNRRVIQGTAQSFNRLAKPIREQATEVRRCFTLLGCITFVHRVYPELDSNGDVAEWKHRGFYYFVHNDKIRNSYDTWKVIESLRKSGFQKRKPDTVVQITPK